MLKIKLIILGFILFILPQFLFAKILHFSLYEKTDKAKYVFVAKCIKIPDKYAELRLDKLSKQKIKMPYEAIYEISEVLKGKYESKTISVKFKKTNETYEPFICRPVVLPMLDENVILFITNNDILFSGFQGKIEYDEATIKSIKKYISINGLSEEKKILKIIETIKNGNTKTAIGLASELRNIDNTKYGANLAELLNHSNIRIRQATISALVRSQDNRIIPSVINMLKNDTVEDLKGRATTVLWRMKDDRITPALIEAYNDSSPIVKFNVIFALSHRYSKEAIPLYLKALKHENHLVRKFGAAAFEWVKYPAAIPELKKLLKDKDKWVRKAAKRSIKCMR